MSNRTSLFVLLLSLCVFALATSLLVSYSALYLHYLGNSASLIGAMTTTHYTGMMLGALFAHRLIQSWGALQAYRGFIGLAILMLVGHLICQNPWGWLILRFVIGYAIAGTYITLELCLLEMSDNQHRGKLLSIYMMALYLGQAGGQSLMSVLPFSGNAIWWSIIGLAVFSLLPLVKYRVPATTHDITQAKIPSTKPLFLTHIERMSPIGMMGCLTAGILLASVYGLLPVYAAQIGLTSVQIGQLMTILLCGAVALQWPMGWLSDYLSRNHVLLLNCSMLILLTALLCFRLPFPLLCCVMFLWGGGLFTLRPLSLGKACENLTPVQLQAACQQLIICYSLGAIVGPLISACWLTWLGARGFMLNGLVMMTCLFLVVLSRQYQWHLPFLSPTAAKYPIT